MTKVEENKSCRNCEYSMSAADQYCRQCGQKYFTGKVTLRSVLDTFFDELFSINSRVYRSMLALFVPGKLTNEYFKGRHKSFAPPLRVFIISSLVFIAALSYLSKQKRIVGFEPEYLAKLEKQAIMSEIDSIQINSILHYEDSLINRAIDSLQMKLTNGETTPSHIGIMRFDFPFQIIIDKQVSTNDVFNMEESLIFEKYNIEPGIDQLLASQHIKITKNPQAYLAYLIGRVTIVTLFMMPMVALMLKALYWRRKYYFVEHFVFSMHYHSVGFLALGLLIFLAVKLASLFVFASTFLVSAGGLYLFLAMKQVYKQNVWKTLLKFTVLNTCYLLFLSIFLTCIFLASMLLY